VEKQKGIEGLVLRGRGHGSIRGEVGQVVSNFFFPKLTRMLSPVMRDVSDDPAEIGFLRSVDVSVSASGHPDAV
jgi:hypothetical protein